MQDPQPVPDAEDIDDDDPPSKRITNAIQGYDKRVDGPMLASLIGLGAMRGECPRIGKWVSKLESLQPRRDSS